MGKFAEISCTRIFLFIFAFCYLPAFGQVLVTDGDTIRYQGEKIRLDGIDAPEINHLDKYATYKREASVGDNTIPFLISCSILLIMAIPQLCLSISNLLKLIKQV